MNQQNVQISKNSNTVLDSPRIKQIVTDCLKDKLADQSYDSQKAPDWLAKSVQAILQKLLERTPNSKLLYMESYFSGLVQVYIQRARVFGIQKMIRQFQFDGITIRCMLLFRFIA